MTRLHAVLLSVLTMSGPIINFAAGLSTDKPKAPPPCDTSKLQENQLDQPFSNYFRAGRTTMHLNRSPPPIPNCHCHRPKGRKLIVAFDGTSNQFGRKNTNVIELYARIEKSEDQRTYYNSGIGTYAKPSWRSWSYWKTVIVNKIDLAIAWNFERIVMGGYRWLSENYQEGDQIFLFGFSRGAYQIRILAGMIETVGLIYPGNEEQIPFAYELYADSSAPSEKYHRAQDEASNSLNVIERLIEGASNWFKHLPSNMDADTRHAREMAGRFKDTFSRPRVRVHFVGVWDTVSSVGIGRSKALPLVHSHEHICFFRQALALDERRVKFEPEYIHGGESVTRHGMNGGIEWGPDQCLAPNLQDSTARWTVKGEGDDDAMAQPRVKEVWFAGSHSDVGGGTKFNEKLDVGDAPSLWMANEAMMAGLKLKASKVEWDWDELAKATPSNSLTWVWWLLEYMPFKRLTYKSATGTTRAIHLGQGRVIKPGQAIHASVAFKLQGKYTPRAVFSTEMKGKSWETIIGKGRRDDIDWANNSTDILEMDLFDHSNAGSLIDRLRIMMEIDGSEGNVHDSLKRLSLFALYDAGRKSIVSSANGCQTLVHILANSTPKLQYASAVVLYRVARHLPDKSLFHSTRILQVLQDVFVEPRDAKVKSAALGILATLDEHYTGDELELELQKARVGIRERPALEWIAKGLKAPESQDFVARGLMWLSRDGDFRRGLLETDAVGSLAVMLKSHDNTVQSLGAEVISNLAQHGEIRAAILQTDAMRSLAAMLQSQYGGSRGLFWSTEALDRVAQDDDARAAILETDAIASLVAMLKSQDSMVQMWGAAKITQFAQYGDFRVALLSLDTINLLAGMLKSEESIVQTFCAEVLASMAQHGNIRSAVLKTDVIDTLVMTLTSLDIGVQYWGTRALANLARHGDTLSSILGIVTPETLAEVLSSE